MEQMDLNQIVVFVRVVEAGSFSGAARSMDLPKSTVSRRLASLERRLGVRLVERTTRKLRLTDIGADYYERCRRILADLGEAEAMVRETQAAPSGVLRVTAPVDLGLDYLDGVAVEFCRQYPEVRLVMTLTSRVVDLVAEGYDVAIRAGRLRDSSLVGKKIASETARLYAAPSYLEEEGAPSCLNDLRAHECLVFGDDVGARWRFEGPRGREEVSVNGPIASNDLGFVRRAAIRGAGIAWLPVMSCVDDVAAGRLVPVLPDHSSSGGSLYVVYPSARHLPAKVRVFVDFVTERVRALLPSGARGPVVGRAEVSSGRER